MLNLIASLLTVASVLQLKNPCWSVPKEEGGGFIYSLAPPVRITAVFITEGRFLFLLLKYLSLWYIVLISCIQMQQQFYELYHICRRLKGR